MSGGRLVDILDAEGHPLFRNLLDDGSNVMLFASGHGFVARDDVNRYRWQIVDAAAAEALPTGRHGPPT